MAFGVTAQGFNRKRLEDVAAETELDWRAEFGDAFDLDPRTPEGQMKGILDERVASLWELAEAIYFSQFPQFAEGVGLDNVVSITGTVRKAERFSTVDSGRGRGVFGTTIPAGTVISVTGNEDARFVTQANEDISIAGIDEVQQISFDLTPDSGTFTLIFDDEETTTLNWNDSAATIQAALEALTTIGSGNVLVAGTIDDTTGLTVTFQSTLGELNQPLIEVGTSALLQGATPVVITPSVTTEGDKPKTPLMDLVAETAGPTQALAGTLTVIETPVAGLDEYTNETDATVGENVESDTALKIRRSEEVAKSGAATPPAIVADLLALTDVVQIVLFQNNTDIVDLEGRPPHSVDIVVQGGTDADVAQQIYESVAAGITFVGDITETIIDENGFPQDIKFSRPDILEIYLEVDLTTTTEFPDDGQAQVLAAILEFGDALKIGQTVVIFGTSSLINAFQEIPGITDVVIRIGTAASPTLDANISVGPRQIADFDSSRIIITEL